MLYRLVLTLYVSANVPDIIVGINIEKYIARYVGQLLDISPKNWMFAVIDEYMENVRDITTMHIDMA